MVIMVGGARLWPVQKTGSIFITTPVIFSNNSMCVRRSKRLMVYTALQKTSLIWTPAPRRSLVDISSSCYPMQHLKTTHMQVEAWRVTSWWLMHVVCNACFETLIHLCACLQGNLFMISYILLGTAFRKGEVMHIRTTVIKQSKTLFTMQSCV